MSSPRVSILLNSPANSVLGPRAEAFARGLAPAFNVECFFRGGSRFGAVPSFLADLGRARPNVVYVVDWGYPAVAAALMYRSATRTSVVVDIGDPLRDLLWATGRLGRVGRSLAHRYERVTLTRAAHVVVRGSALREYAEQLGARAVTVVPDGVDGDLFRPLDAAAVSTLRVQLGLDGSLVVGVMGTLSFSERLRWGYGVELLQALAALPALPVTGLIVGDGPGRTRLESMATELGVRDRVRFQGYVTFAELPRYINVMDVCLSTQTNDSIGRGRTTAKLPLFLSCGRFVLASRVGEAAIVLPDEMLVDYAEGFDAAYPWRLADRIARLVADRRLLAGAAASRRIAQAHYDYRVLVPQVAGVIKSVLSAAQGSGNPQR